MKLEKLGTVWTAQAKLYNKRGELIGYCLDTPNAIAKALMEKPNITLIKSPCHGTKVRSEYNDRMKPWNEASSKFMRA